MKSVVRISALRFPVTVRSGENAVSVIPVVLSKEQLRAAQTVGQSSKELIVRLCSRAGYIVADIGKPERKTLAVDLAALWGEE